MIDDEKTQADVLWKMYQENCTQGRHHETQRSTVVSTTIVIAAAVIGLVTFDKQISQSDLPLTIFLVALGIFSAAFSIKHYELFRKHMMRADGYRKALDTLLPSRISLVAIKEQADKAHEEKFHLMKQADEEHREKSQLEKQADEEHKKRKRKYPKWLRWLPDARLYYWWASLGLLIASLGIIMTIFAIQAPQKAP